MQKAMRRIGGLCLALALSGAALFSTGCDPTLQAAVENGIITSSQSLLASILQAAIAVAGEKTTGTTGTGTTGTGTTGTGTTGTGTTGTGTGTGTSTGA